MRSRISEAAKKARQHLPQRRRRATALSGPRSWPQRICAIAAPWHATAAACLFMLFALAYALVLGGHLGAVHNFAWRVGNGVADLVGLSIREVTVTGLERSRTENILEIVGVARGVSMIGFDAVSARRRLEERDWIATASIRRQFPDRLHITVREREPYALWQINGEFHVVDREGVALTTFAVGDYIDLPIVVGAGAAEQGERLLNHLEAWPEIRLRVRAAVRVAERRWTLHLTNGLKILLPEDGLATALMRTDRLHREFALLDRDIVAVDMRLGDRTTLQLSEEAMNAHMEVRRELSTSSRDAGT